MPAPTRPLSETVEVTSLNPCIPEGALIEAVANWLERDEVDARLRIRVTAARETTFIIRLGDGPPLVRDFPDLPGDCAAQTSALALSLALAIDALAPPRAEAPPPGRRLGGSLLVTTGFPERAAVGGKVSIAGRATGPLWLVVGASGLVASDQELQAGSPTRFDAGLAAGSLSACAVLQATRAVGLEGCAGPALGATVTRGFDLEGGRTESEVWLAIVPALGIHFALTARVGIHLGAELLVPLRGGTVRATGGDGTSLSRPFPGLVAAFGLGPTASF